MECAFCGAGVHQYSDAFRALWATAMECFPLYALPTPRVCLDCTWVKLGYRPAKGYKVRRRLWLRSSPAPVVLDVTDPAVQAMLKRGRVRAKAFRKLRAKQRVQWRKLVVRRMNRKQDRVEKETRKRIQAVLDVAIEIANEE